MLPAHETIGGASAIPEHEPEVWDETVEDFNPHQSRAPEPPPVAVSPVFAAQEFHIDRYLEQERSKDLLRFSTAGSVDDGKSTLIGRLLFDTQSVYDDQLRSIEGKGTTAPGVLDLALLTDGLRAEREQAITIDVAYRYFSTARRKFIIADTPGHEQYTRNMATGASTADAAIILVDARKGVLAQSRRHAYISALLGVRHIIVAVNKMDLVGYEQAAFDRIVADFANFFLSLEVPGILGTALHSVPVSALHGDNVVHRSVAMPWHSGSTLLGLLESLPPVAQAREAPFRMAVQRVVRPDMHFRGFAGQIASGTIRRGDSVRVFPSGATSRIDRIVTFDGDLEQAAAPLSVTLTLEHELDISRGDSIANPKYPLNVASILHASLVWMDHAELMLTKRYILKHMCRSAPAYVRALNAVADFDEGTVPGARSTLQLNEVGIVTIEVLQPIAFDLYEQNRYTGSFVLIDAVSNLTVAAGMIRSAQHDTAPAAALQVNAVTPAEREARYRHTGAFLQVGSKTLLDALERALFNRGAMVARFALADAAGAKAAAFAGVLSLVPGESANFALRATMSDRTFSTVATGDLTKDVAVMVDELIRAGVLL